MGRYYYRASIRTKATGETDMQHGFIEVDGGEEYAMEAIRDRLLDVATAGQEVRVHQLIEDQN